MKIVSGTPKDKFIGKRITCTGCEAVLKIEHGDRFRIENDRGELCRIYKCANCKKEIWISIT